jgi:NAD(P)-dependent dehydrogenase (short-subunit alcohol dehydrogenase family)
LSRVALVSGASRGIGAEIARQLAADHGFVVFAGARDPDDVEEADRIVPIELDVTDEDAIFAAQELIGSDPGHLDALVNNAGIYGDPIGAADYDLERAHEVLEVNLFGPWRLIEAFVPLLRRSDAPRIVNVSSGGGQLADGADGWAPAYCISKTALNGVTSQLAAALPTFAINSVCPGWVRTDMGGAGATRSVGEGAAGIVWLAAEAAQTETGKFWRDRKVIPW